MISVYGLKNCDTCRKALNWLDTNGQVCQFHDFRAEGVNESHLRRWIADKGLKKILNTRSTTWRGLSAEQKNGVDSDVESAVALMLEHPALIKRPVFEYEGEIVVGFTAAELEALERFGP